MRAFILLPALVLVIASANYWATKRVTPVTGNDNVKASTVLKAVGLKRDTLGSNASTQPSLTKQVTNKDAQVYDMNNPADKDKMTASLKNEGVPEKEIQRILNPVRKASPSIEKNVAEAESYDMNSPADKERMITSLKADGVTEEEIQRILNPARETSPPIEVNVADAESYDMNNPIDKEQLAASLKAEGIPEKEIQQILRHPATNPQFPASN